MTLSSAHAHLEEMNKGDDDANENGASGTNDSEMDYLNGNEDANDSEMTSGCHTSTSSCLSDSPIADGADQDTMTASTDLQKDILIAVLKAFELMEETKASQKSFMNILDFGRDLAILQRGLGDD